jgi:hypothetical protein
MCSFFSFLSVPDDQSASPKHMGHWSKTDPFSPVRKASDSQLPTLTRNKPLDNITSTRFTHIQNTTTQKTSLLRPSQHNDLIKIRL